MADGIDIGNIKGAIAEAVTEGLINAFRNGGVNGNGGGNSFFNESAFRQNGMKMTMDDYERLTGPRGKSNLEQYWDEKDALKKINEELELQSDLFDEIEEKIKNGIELSEEEYRLIQKKNQAMQLSSNMKGRNGFTSFMSDINEFGRHISNMGRALSSVLDPFRKADAAATKYARAVGLSSTALKNLRNDTLDNIVDNKLAAKYNMSTEELLAAQSNYMKAAGRNIRVSNIDQENMAAMEMVTQGKGTEMAALLDNFGVSMTSTAELVGRMYSDASKEGLSFEKYSDNVAKNIKLAQNYTFKNGIKGLESMAKKATAMKMDMQQVAALADNVSTVEGSIDVAAKLQVLGGPFAQMADPLGMLNEGLNDMEGLQDRLIKMVGGMGGFNKETGEVQVSSFNKQRIKAAAQAMGISYDSLMESVNAQARRNEIEQQIKNSANASGLSEEMQELIKNSGSFKDGKAGVSIRGEFKSLDQLTEEDKEALQKETQSESEDIKDIAYNTRSLVEIESGFQKQKEATQANMVRSIGDLYKELAGWLSEQGWLHKILVGISIAVAVGNAVSSGMQAWNSLKNIGSNFKGLKGRFQNFRANGAGNSIGNFGRGKAGSALGKTGSSLPAGTKLNSAGRLVDAKTGRFVSTKNLNVAQGAANNVGVKGATSGVGSQVAKGGVKRTANRALIKTVGKEGAKKAMGVGAKMAGSGASVAVTGGLGIVGAVGDIVTDSLVANGKIEKGGVGHHVGKGLSGAATGAAIGATVGSFVPVIGNIVGGIVGAIGGAAVGLFKAGSAKEQKKIEDQLKGTGVTMKGDYGRGKLEKINHALKTGYIDDKLRAKLEKKGDQELLAQIDKKAAEQKAKGITPEKMNANDGIWGKMARFGLLGPVAQVFSWGKKYVDSAKGKRQIRSIKNKFKKSAIGKAVNRIANPKTAFGKGALKVAKGVGLALGGPLAWTLNAVKKKKEKEEKVKLRTGKLPKELLRNKLSSGVRPIPEKGMSSTYGGVDKANNDIHLKTDPQNINLNGTLNLRGDDGKNMNIISDLKNNPDMMRNLTGMISQEMSVLNKGANFHRV